MGKKQRREKGKEEIKTNKLTSGDFRRSDLGLKCCLELWSICPCQVHLTISSTTGLTLPVTHYAKFRRAKNHTKPKYTKDERKGSPGDTGPVQGLPPQHEAALVKWPSLQSWISHITWISQRCTDGDQDHNKYCLRFQVVR